MSTGFRKDRSSFYNGRKKLWRSSANLAGREKSDDSIQEFVFAIERILEFSIIYFFFHYRFYSLPLFTNPTYFLELVRRKVEN